MIRYYCSNKLFSIIWILIENAFITKQNQIFGEKMSTKSFPQHINKHKHLTDPPILSWLCNIGTLPQPVSFFGWTVPHFLEMLYSLSKIFISLIYLYFIFGIVTLLYDTYLPLQCQEYKIHHTSYFFLETKASLMYFQTFQSSDNKFNHLIRVVNII